MSTSRPFAYNTESLIPGTEQIGNIAIGVSTSLNYSSGAGGLRWWNGPDEDLGYVIAQSVPSGNQPNPDGVSASVGFFRSSEKSEISFVELANVIQGGSTESFTTGLEARTWLNANGYWTSYIDEDVQAFLTATGITDSTITSAINTFVIGLKENNLWTKMRAIYPFVGGTAATHRFNLKDPRDLDVAHRLIFSGGISHTSLGVLPGGVNGWANTYVNPSLVLTNNDTHISYYSRTSASRGSIEIGLGVDFNASSNRIVIHVSWSDGNMYSDAYNFGTARIAQANSNAGQGYYIQTRTSSSSHKVFKNGTQLGATNTGDSGNVTLINGNIPLFGLWNTSTNGMVSGLFSNRECSMATIGNGLSDSESSTLTTLVNNFQTTLGRAL